MARKISKIRTFMTQPERKKLTRDDLGLVGVLKYRGVKLVVYYDKDTYETVTFFNGEKHTTSRWDFWPEISFCKLIDDMLDRNIKINKTFYIKSKQREKVLA